MEILVEPKKEISEFVWWVVPDKLLGVRKPETPEEVDFLKSIGVGGIITLLDDEENHKLYESTNIDFLWTPVKGGTAPSKDQVSEAAEFIQHENAQGKAVAIHCNNGRKRTGTMLAAQLFNDGMKADEAIKRIIHINPDANLSETQREFIRGLTR